jgi:glycosyltransferase involved in cell wall biosynthesis
MIAPTAFLRDAYVRNRFAAGKLHLSHFGVDVDRRRKPERAAEEPLTVGFIGQIAPHKGVDLLVAAARALPEGSVRVKIYGPANQDPAYMARLRSMAGRETQFFDPFPPARMAEVLGEFDLLAIPSTWYENSPLVLLNALATHTPVLVSNVQGLTEFIEEGRSGWSFRRGDLGDLTAVLARLSRDVGRVRRASEETSYERTTRVMALDVATIYDAVLTAVLSSAAEPESDDGKA